MNADLIDIAVRGAGTGVCVVIAILIWLSRIERSAQLAFTLLALSTTFNMWTRVGPLIGISDDVLRVMWVFNASGAFAMTWLAIAIFLDDARYSVFWLLSGGLIWGCILMTPLWPEMIPYLRGYAALHFLGLLALVVYSGVGDLLNARRRFRPVVTVFLLVYCVSQALTQTPLKDVRTVDTRTAQPAVFLCLVILFAVWALKANMRNWPGKTLPTAETAPTPEQRSAQQSALIKRIEAEMGEGVWKVEGLTVGALAQRVNAPEHRVRRAINQELGHRNFASFITRARIDAAKARLHSEDADQTTILEVAFDVGFSSLGPFNRAFREATGQSPTDFRKSLAMESGAAS